MPTDPDTDGAAEDGQTAATADRSAAPAAANAGADARKGRFAPPGRLIADGALSALFQSAAAAGNVSPAQGKGAPSRAAERARLTLPHPPSHPAGNPGVTPPSITTAVLSGASATAIAVAGPPTADHASGNPADRLASRRDAPIGGENRSAAPVRPGADRSIAAAVVGANGQALPDDGTAAPGSGAAAPNTAPRPADSPAAPSGMPVSPPEPSPPRISDKPVSLPAAPIPMPNHAPPHPEQTAAPGAGQVAAGTNPFPAVAVAGQRENSATATDAASPEPTAMAWAEQLPARMLAAAADDRRDLALRLHPSGLGDVSVRLVVTGRDVSAWFDSPQLPVQQAISQGMGDLQQGLATAGYDLSGAWVGGEAWTPRERTASPALPRPSRSMTGGGPDEAAHRTAPMAAGSGVSVYV